MIKVPFTDSRSPFALFGSDTRGSTAIIFALAAIPIMLVAGAAMDYSLALTEKERMQHALDSSALALALEPKTAALAVLQQKAETHFSAVFRSTAMAAAPVLTVEKAGSGLRLEASANIRTAFMAIAGVNSLPLRAVSTSRSEHKKVEIALVLDNTGSMAQLGKMTALKGAVSDLIDRLKERIVEADDVKMSIIPFNTEIKIHTSNVNAPWLRWDVTLENASFGMLARQPPSQLAWEGCLSDRDQPYDASSEPAPDQFHRYVASKCHFPGLSRMAFLTTDMESIRDRANSMTPTGNTNVTIGLSTGLATLRPDSPFGTAASSNPNVKKFVIVVTDGENTMNRWTNNPTQIDDRLRVGCDQARSNPATRNISVFTIRVLAGNAALLRNCATEPGMYYDVDNASQLQSVFRKILEAIDDIRLTS